MTTTPTISASPSFTAGLENGYTPIDLAGGDAYLVLVGTEHGLFGLVAPLFQFFVTADIDTPPTPDDVMDPQPQWGRTVHSGSSPTDLVLSVGYIVPTAGQVWIGADVIIGGGEVQVYNVGGTGEVSCDISAGLEQTLSMGDDIVAPAVTDLDTVYNRIVRVGAAQDGLITGGVWVIATDDGTQLRDEPPIAEGVASDVTGACAAIGVTVILSAVETGVLETAVIELDPIWETPTVIDDPVELHAWFTGNVHTPSGIVTEAPVQPFTAAFTGTVRWPRLENVDWWGVLVDRNGQVLAHDPAIQLAPVTENLNQQDTTEIVVPVDTPAGRLVVDTTVLPEVELQVWRGDRLFFFGPLVDDDPEGVATRRVQAKDASWHLWLRHVGELGAQFGGHTPDQKDYLENPAFAQGLTGWSTLRTVTWGIFPGFAEPAPGMVTVDNVKRFPGYDRCIKFDTPHDPDDGIQLYQDLQIRTPPHRGFTLRFSGYWWIDDDAFYQPTTQRFALLLVKLPAGADLPFGYYTELFDWSFTVLAEQVERGVPVYHETSIEFPPNVDQLLHVAICAPQGVSRIAGCELRGDDGIDYLRWDAPSLAGNLVLHAQDTGFGKTDANVDQDPEVSTDLIDRTFVYEDHTNIGQAIDSLARDGYFDWSMVNTRTTRTFTTWAPRRGVHRSDLAVQVDADGHGNIAELAVSNKWAAASTSIAAQSQTPGGRHEAAASIDGATVTLEEVFSADRDTRPCDLQGRADEHLAAASAPVVVEFTCRPGDERYLLDLRVGDTLPIYSAKPGQTCAGIFRVVRKETSPANDTSTFTCNQEPSR